MTKQTIAEENALPFTNSDEFYHWLSIHHDTHAELWMKIYKKSSSTPSIDWQESVKVALCWGWIDGIKKSLNSEAYLQRFTPRKAKSIWSKRNTEHVSALIAQGLMTDHGMHHVNTAKNGGRWEAAYAISEMIVAPDFIDALEGDLIAKDFYNTLSKSHRAIIAYALNSAKKPETRLKRFNKYFKMLSNQEKPK